VAGAATGVSEREDGGELKVIATNGHSNGQAVKANGNGGGGITLSLGNTKVAFALQGDAPSCMDCGSIMVGMAPLA
jgi:hypothetical protein